MKKTIIALILFAGAALAQSLPFDSMRGTYRVVTNEQDVAAIELLNASNAVAVSVSAGLTESNALRVAEIAGLVPQITGLYASNATVFASVGALELGTNAWNAAAALAATALQPPATNTLADAAAHAATAHSVSADGGFAGGTEATASYGGALGSGAAAGNGGAVGEGAAAGGGFAGGQGASATAGGAVGLGAVSTDGGFAGGVSSTASYGGALGSGAAAGNGGAVGEGAAAGAGGAVGEGAAAGAGFAGGFAARAKDGDTLIDAIQLGTGVNPDAGTLQVYDYKLMGSDGTIPEERIPVGITNQLLSKAEAAATYLPLANIPGPGCTELGTDMAVTLTGATTAYMASPTGTVTLAVSESAPRYSYALELYGTNAVTMGTGLTLFGSWTPTGTNIVAVVPSTGTLWRVYGRGL